LFYFIKIICQLAKQTWLVESILLVLVKEENGVLKSNLLFWQIDADWCCECCVFTVRASP